MSNTIPNALSTIVVEAVTQMLATVEACADFKVVSTGAAPAAPGAVEVAAVLGYTGEQAKGSIVVTTTRHVVDRSHPNHGMGMPVTEADLVDWAGEMANQMLGRIKNQLVVRGVSFNMATPTAVLGKSIEIRPPKDGYTVEVTVTGKVGTIAVHFLTVLGAAVDLNAPGQKVAGEGDSFLF